MNTKKSRYPYRLVQRQQEETRKQEMLRLQLRPLFICLIVIEILIGSLVGVAWGLVISSPW